MLDVAVPAHQLQAGDLIRVSGDWLELVTFPQRGARGRVYLRTTGDSYEIDCADGTTATVAGGRSFLVHAFAVLRARRPMPDVQRLAA